MFFKKPWLFLFLFVVGPGSAQTSVQQLVDSARYYSSLDKAKTIRICNELLKKAPANDRVNQAWAYNYLGAAYYYTSNIDSAFYFHFKAFEIRKEINDAKGMGASYNNLGNLYDYKGDNVTAMRYYLMALPYFKSIDFYDGLAIVNNSIGNLYYIQRQNEKALQHFKQSLDYYKKTNNHNGMIGALSNLAVVYDELKDTVKAFNMYQSLEWLASKTGNDPARIISLNNLGQILVHQGRYEEGLEKLRASIRLNLSSINDSSRLFTPYIQIGRVFENRHEFDSARFYYAKANEVARRSKYSYFEMESLERLSVLMEKKGDYRSAYHLFRSSENIEDSLFQVETANQVKELETRYQTLEKQQRIDLLERKKKTDLWLTIGISVFAALVSAFLFFAWRALKLNRQKNKLLNEQKTEILKKNEDLNNKNVLIASQNQEIKDSIVYAAMIQKAVTGSENEFRKHMPASFVFFKPRDIVSGDFFWSAAIEQEGTHYVFWAMADCTGHGVPGALMSILGHSFLNEIVVAGRTHEPDEILNTLREKIISALNRESAQATRDGMDIILCRYCVSTNELVFAGANHALYHLRNNEVNVLKTDKQPVGYWPKQEKFTRHTLPLMKGDKLFSTTDGLIDQFNGITGEKLKSRRFREFVSSLDGASTQNALQKIEELFAHWKGESYQVDDVLVVGVQI